ncbi:DUF6012 family protein [Pseudomonas mosselii]|uniref:DUF6012 family protein n=1 Tax=Pseudomonas mosselii TaxID=78327 RepID=UPI0038579881
MPGFYIQAPKESREFTATTCRAVGAEYLLTLIVKYSILDSDCDAASDNSMFWGNLHPSHGWPTRCAGWLQHRFPTDFTAAGATAA